MSYDNCVTLFTKIVLTFAILCSTNTIGLALFSALYHEKGARMDPLCDPTTAIAFSVWLLLLLLNNKDVVALPQLIASDEREKVPVASIVENLENRSSDAHN